MIASAQDINLLLREIEQELKCIDLWSFQPPESTRLSFPAWVQWVMIPTFDRVLLKYGELPQSCKLTPVARLALQSADEQTDNLLTLIEELDNLLSQKAENTKKS